VTENQPTRDELVEAMAWMRDVVEVGDTFDGPTITYPDGSVVHYKVPTQAELDEA
jgi:hypothetical protein